MKRTYIIIFCIIALIILLVSIFFKIKHVPDIKWKRDFDMEKHDAGDAFLFYELLNKKYGPDNVELYKEDDFEYLEDYQNSLLVILQDGISLDSIMTEQLVDFISGGNEALVIAEKFKTSEGFYESELSNRSTMRHSTSKLTWLDCTSYVMEHYWYHLDSTNVYKSYYFEEEWDDNYTAAKTLLYLNDSLPVFRQVDIDSGKLYVHTMPDMFMNILGLQDAYRQNFNKTFSLFDNDRVVVHKFRRKNFNAGANEDSLLKYILSQRALKYAYYLGLIFSIIFLAFSAKRKQKYIPLIEPVENTSLEYIHTTSELFRAQKQNRKLVPHLGRVYHHKIAKRYYLDHDNPEFMQKLAIKSKVPIALIEKIEKQIKSAGVHEFNDDQLFKLYNDINSFFKSCK